ncbi:MAG: SRPBCC family protein [Mycobacteriales bacterium]
MAADPAEETVVVGVPAERAFAAWSHFADLPRFVPGVHAVDQRDPITMRWLVEADGGTRWLAVEVARSEPPDSVTWSCPEAPEYGGTARFQRLTNSTAAVVLTGGGSRAKEALARFKEFVEAAA